jgi:hypothetical protein
MAGISGLDWQLPGYQDQNAAVGSDANGNPTGGSDYYLSTNVYGNPDWMKALGYTSGMPAIGGSSPEGVDVNYQQGQSDFNKWMQDRGYAVKVRRVPGENQGFAQVFDSSGNPVGPQVTNNLDPDDQFGYGALAAMAITGANVAAAGALGGAAGGAEAAGGATGGLPEASYSLEGAHYGVGGLDAATASPINAGLGGVGEVAGTAGAGSSLPGAEYSNEGIHYGAGGLDPVTNAPVNVGAGAAGSVGSSLSNLGSSFKDWAAKNPMQAIQLAGMLGGKLFGGGKSSGGGGGIGSVDQSALTATQPAAFQREYVAPPAGFKPGISGEHVYFKNKGS